MKQKYQSISENKAQADTLIFQLSQGEYKSLDTYANNIAHLNVIFNTCMSYIQDVSFLTWLKEHDPVMTAELVMIGKILMCHYNFFRLTLIEYSKE